MSCCSEKDFSQESLALGAGTTSWSVGNDRIWKRPETAGGGEGLLIVDSPRLSPLLCLLLLSSSPLLIVLGR